MQTNKTAVERQGRIREILRSQGSASIDELAQTLQVTGATIRKDVRDMESRRELYRNRGVVSLSHPKIVDLGIDKKIFINTEKKNYIAEAAAALIDVNDTILLTSGSTVEALSRVINPVSALSVVTSSVNVALHLLSNELIDVTILGGHIVRNSHSVRDFYSVNGLKHVCGTKMFLSCDALTPKGDVITAFVEEATFTKAMMQCCTRCILLADSSKIGKSGLGKICDISDIDILVTDAGIERDVREGFEKKGVKVIIAGPKNF